MGNKTPLYDEHLNLGGRIVEFGGYDMPVQYSSAIEEHNAVRKYAGLFDVSHMGEFRVKGNGCRDYLQALIPSSMDKLTKNKGMYTCFCNETGGIIDDIFIFMISDNEYFIVVNAGSKEKDFSWLKKHIQSDVFLEDLTADIAKIDIQGPLSEKILKKIFDPAFISSINRFYFNHTEYAGVNIMVSNTGYTGEAGFELYIDRSKAVVLWNQLLETGRGDGLIPCGLAARDSLRLEASYSLYGHELTEEVNPIEAGLSWLISNNSGFIGSEKINLMKEKGSERRIYCISMTGRGIPREGYKVEKDGEEIGYLTSGGFSPVFGKGIALGMLKKGFVKTGDSIEIVIRMKKVEAEIVKRPFYSFNG